MVGGGRKEEKREGKMGKRERKVEKRRKIE